MLSGEIALNNNHYCYYYYVCGTQDARRGSDLIKWPEVCVKWHFYNTRSNLSAYYFVL